MQPKLLLVCSAHRCLPLLEALEGKHLQVDCAAGLAEAQEKLGSEHPYGLVLVDSELSDGGWRALLQVSRDFNLTVPWVVCARIEDHKLWTEALEHGAFDLITEPYDPAEVARIVDGALKSRIAQ